MAEQVTELTAEARHPLDPPTKEEIERAGVLVKRKLNDQVIFSSLALVEPPKYQVIEFEANGLNIRASVDRMVRVQGYDTVKKHSFAATVDVGSNVVTDVRYISEGQAPINFPDVVRVITICKTDESWQNAMRARGVEDFTHVQIDPWPTGGYLHPSIPEGHRAMRAISFVREDKFDNGYARPVQGLIAHVDLTDEKIVFLEDHGVVELPPEHGRYQPEHQPSLREAPKPISITQPEGTSFKVNGHAVQWQKWQFRISMHPIHGLVLHQVGYQDGDRLRPILYRASLSDMVVPYGDPNPMHHWKHVFDASEASIGTLPNSLTLGCDCLGEIHYFDVDVMTHQGEARRIENAICMHEEDYGILWKHYDGHTQKQEVRRSRRLVVSAIHTVGNYEYGFFWYFYLDGTLQMEVKLTGIVGVSAVADGTEQPEYAPLIAPNLASPVHQHLFNFRLDFDLDGGPNSVYEVNTIPLPSDHPDNPHGTAFHAEAKLLARESEAQRNVNAASSRNWKVVNPESKNRMGIPVAYKLLPGATPVLLANPDSPVGKRAAFATHNLWVTPYDDAEMSAAGDHTNLHPGGAGLSAWTQQDRGIENTDVVLWHTVGLTHVPRPEDWPVMPVEYCGFMLQPVGFFERNPALDLPGEAHC